MDFAKKVLKIHALSVHNREIPIDKSKLQILVKYNNSCYIVLYEIYEILASFNNLRNYSSYIIILFFSYTKGNFFTKRQEKGKILNKLFYL